MRRAHIIYKVKANTATRPQVASAVEMFRAKIVDVGPDSVSIEATGELGKVEALREVLEPFGIKEIVQSGTVAIGRGAKSITDRALRS